MKKIILFIIAGLSFSLVYSQSMIIKDNLLYGDPSSTAAAEVEFNWDDFAKVTGFGQEEGFTIDGFMIAFMYNGSYFSKKVDGAGIPLDIRGKMMESKPEKIYFDQVQMKFPDGSAHLYTYIVSFK